MQCIPNEFVMYSNFIKPNFRCIPSDFNQNSRRIYVNISDIAMIVKTERAIDVVKGNLRIRQEGLYQSRETRKTAKKAEEKTPQRHVLNI